MNPRTFITALAAVCLIAWALFQPAWSMASRDQSAFDRRADELLTWAADFTGYSRTNVKLKVEFVSAETINRLFFGAKYRGQDDFLAATVNNRIQLRDDFELGRDDFILLHEIVHVLQFENGAEFRCKAAQELEAYRAQIAFADETGATAPFAKPGALWMIVIEGSAKCDD